MCVFVYYVRYVRERWSVFQNTIFYVTGKLIIFLTNGNCSGGKKLKQM